MSAVLELPKIKPTPAERRRAIVQAIKDYHHAVFFQVSYQTYEQILEKYPDMKNPRLTFDRGVLEIMPLPFHDTSERLLDEIFVMFADELEFEDFINYGSTTQKRKRLDRGCEADSSFYIGANAKLMRGRERVLETDPPPDLVFEIDVTHSSVSKIPIYAALGILEIWQIEKKTLKILVLENTAYSETQTSRVLSGVSSQILNEFIRASETLSRSKSRRKVWDWAAQNLKSKI